MARETQTTMIARLETTDGGLELSTPSVGIWRGGPDSGALVRPGVGLGYIEILGVAHELVAPEGAFGVVKAQGKPGPLRRAVSCGDCLVVLDTEIVGGAGGSEVSTDADTSSSELVFRASMSGRFYLRASPDKPSFITVGDTVEVGHTICLLEVMKTFNRVTYGGDKLPARAQIVRILPEDGADVDEGDVLLELAEA